MGVGMIVHHDKGLVYQLHQKTASRQTRDILEKRGFVELAGHHDSFASDNLKYDQWSEAWWRNFHTFMCTVRDHFDYFLTRWQQDLNLQAVKDGVAPAFSPVTVKWLQGNRQANPRWSLMRGKLWHLWWENEALTSWPGTSVHVVWFENLRDGLNALLHIYDLPVISDDEWHEDQWKTKLKPRERPPWEYFTEEAVNWMLERYWFERELLSYPNEGLKHWGAT